MENQDYIQIILKNSAVPGAVIPADNLMPGEFAMNIADDIIYTKDVNTGAVIPVNDASYIKLDSDKLKFINVESALLGLIAHKNKIQRPRAIYPSTGDIDIPFRPTLVGGLYVHFDNTPRLRRHFQVDEVFGDFSDPIHEGFEDSDTNFIETDLPSGVMKWRYRDESTTGDISEWSCVNHFSTITAKVETPFLQVEGSPLATPESPTLIASGFNVIDGDDVHATTDYRVILGNNLIWQAVRVGEEKLLQITLPEGLLDEDTLYDFQVRFNSTQYGSSDWKTVQSTTKMNFVETPVIISPNTGITDFFGEVTATTEQEGIEISEWEVGSDASFQNVIDFYRGSENALAWTPALDMERHHSSTFFVRVRHRVSRFWSNWSNIIQFSTPVISIDVPVLSIAGNLSLLPENPILSLSTFSVTNGTDDHSSTDWQIRNDLDEVIYEEFGSPGEDLLSKTIPLGVLEAGKTYTFAARQIGSTYGESEWVELQATTKTQFVSIPTITSPTSGAVDFSGLIVATSDITPEETNWEVSTLNDFSFEVSSFIGAGNLANWDPEIDGSLYNGVELFTRVRHKVGSFWSEWSNVVSFTTPLVGIDLPVISVEGAPSSIPSGPNLTGSNFNVTGGSDSHQSTDWELKDSAGGTVWSEMGSTGSLTSIKIPDDTLTHSETYTFRVRYNGVSYGSSEWGEVEYSTPTVTITTPVLTVSGAPSSVQATPTLAAQNDFEITGATDSHQSSDWKVELQNGDPVWESVGDTENLLDIEVPIENLTVSTSYVFKLRFNSSQYGSSEWVEVSATTDSEFKNLEFEKLGVSGTIYYADADNGSDLNEGSESLPFATLEKAVNTAVNGDGIKLNASTTAYSENFTFNKAVTVVGSGKGTKIGVDSEFSLFDGANFNGTAKFVQCEFYGTRLFNNAELTVNIHFFNCFFDIGNNLIAYTTSGGRQAERFQFYNCLTLDDRDSSAPDVDEGIRGLGQWYDSVFVSKHTNFGEYGPSVLTRCWVNNEYFSYTETNFVIGTGIVTEYDYNISDFTLKSGYDSGNNNIGLYSGPFSWGTPTFTGYSVSNGVVTHS